MSKSLSMTLKETFPDRAFHVYTHDVGDDYGPVIGFHSVL